MNTNTATVASILAAATVDFVGAAMLSQTSFVVGENAPGVLGVITAQVRAAFPTATIVKLSRPSLNGTKSSFSARFPVGYEVIL